MPVRARIIDGPVEILAAAKACVDARVAQARSGPLGFLVPVRGKRKILVFRGLVLFERPLRAQSSPDAQCGGDEQHYRTESHGVSGCDQIITSRSQATPFRRQPRKQQYVIGYENTGAVVVSAKIFDYDCAVGDSVSLLRCSFAVR